MTLSKYPEEKLSPNAKRLFDIVINKEVASYGFENFKADVETLITKDKANITITPTPLTP